MENFIVSARKYRPQVFEEVVGQQHVTRTLKNAIQQNHLAQALLFTGPRGVGKTTCARILARMINEDDGITEDSDFSFNIFELDAASNNSVDDIRNLIDQVRFAPQIGNFKVYIIDEVHMLSSQAFNAFLKTLEEPPKHAIFILATTEKHKIIPTILSRCQIYDFKRIGVEDIASHLLEVAKKEGIEIEKEAVHVIAQKADGALRDALSIFDRIVSFSGNKVTYQEVIDNLRILDYDYYFRTTEHILNQDQAALLLLFDKVLDNGFDGHQYINGLAAHFRDLLVCKDPRTLELLEVSDSTKSRYSDQAHTTPVSFLLKGLKLASEVDTRYKSSNNPRLLVELCLLQLHALIAGEAEKKTPHLSPPTAKSKPVAPEPPTQIAYQPVKKIPEVVTSKSVDVAAESIAPPPQVHTPEATEKISSQPEELLSTKEEPPKFSKPNRRKRQGISINEALNNQEAAEDIDDEKEEVDLNLPKDDFADTQLENFWQEYLQQIKEAGGKRVYSSLSNKKLKLKEDFVVELELDNDIQVDFFNEEKTEILLFLRNKLNNFSIKFETVKSAITKTLEPYTAQEKYEYMVKKNPLLKEFRDKLDLDLE